MIDDQIVEVLETCCSQKSVDSEDFRHTADAEDAVFGNRETTLGNIGRI